MPASYSRWEHQDDVGMAKMNNPGLGNMVSLLLWMDIQLFAEIVSIMRNLKIGIMSTSVDLLNICLPFQVVTPPFCERVGECCLVFLDPSSISKLTDSCQRWPDTNGRHLGQRRRVGWLVDFQPQVDQVEEHNNSMCYRLVN